MKTIDINKQIGVTTILYPDNQPHINLGCIEIYEQVRVICSLTNSTKLIELLQVADALDNAFVDKQELHIPYLMAARFDRIMQSGDSFDLKVVCKMINMCGFKRVYLYDVHSDVSTALIHNSISVPSWALIKEFNKENSLLICPDAGAVKKVGKSMIFNKNLKDVVYCNKTRDLSNGNLTLKVLEPEKCQDRNCAIIDDLCDGGGTFLAIADQIKPKSLTLIVTHGIFSKGFSKLEEKFDEIIVSDSYCQEYNSKIVKTIKLIQND